MRGTHYLFLLILLFSCSTEKEYPTPDLSDIYFQDGEVQTVFENRPNGINLIFIGDGYVQKDLYKDRGLYRRDAIKHIDFIFDNPPFSEYKEYFNAYIIYAESTDEGPSYDSRTKSTALGVIQGEYTQDSFSEDKLASYIKRLIPEYKIYEQNNVVLLSTKNGVGGTANLGVALFVNTNEAIMLHELGHSLANLGDEYEEHPTKNITYFDTNGRPNLDNTDDLTKIKWKHFVGLENYKSIGSYEGGGYTAKGIWRPQENSIMRESWGNYPFFNAPSREAIVIKIMELNELPYSFDDFILHDKTALDTISSRLLSSKKITYSFSCGY